MDKFRHVGMKFGLVFILAIFIGLQTSTAAVEQIPIGISVWDSYSDVFTGTLIFHISLI